MALRALGLNLFATFLSNLVFLWLCQLSIRVWGSVFHRFAWVDALHSSTLKRNSNLHEWESLRKSNCKSSSLFVDAVTYNYYVMRTQVWCLWWQIRPLPVGCCCLKKIIWSTFQHFKTFHSIKHLQPLYFLGKTGVYRSKMFTTHSFCKEKILDKTNFVQFLLDTVFQPDYSKLNQNKLRLWVRVPWGFHFLPYYTHTAEQQG